MAHDPAARSPRTEQVRSWYQENASRFADVPTIQPNLVFSRLEPEEQRRLNRFKLWFIGPGREVDVSNRDILEFGCGHGRMALQVPGYRRYVGIEFVPEFVEMAVERIRAAGLEDRASVVCSDCLRYEGEAEAFDVVCALGMFEFVESPEETIRKMAYHLKPGGALFIDGHYSSPLYDWLRRRKHRQIEREQGFPKRLFSGREVLGYFRDAGLERGRILMKEWPLLGGLYARRGWETVLAFRNRIAPVRGLHWFGTDFVGLAWKPEAR